MAEANWCWSLVPDQAGLDVEFERFEQAGFVSLDRNRAHDGVVGAVFEWCDVEGELVLVAGLAKLFAERRIGCDAAADANRF